MNDGGGDGGVSFKVNHGSDAAEVTDKHEAGAGKVGDVVGERLGSKVTPRVRTSSEVKVVEEE